VVEGLVEAITTRRRARLTYEPPVGSEGPVQVLFEPYRLRLVQEGLYCVGVAVEGTSAPRHDPMTSLGLASVSGSSGDSSGLAVLSVHRINAVELTEERFVVARGFDPARFDAQVFGILGGPPETVVIRFGAGVAPYIRAREWHPSQTLRELADGRLELTFRAGGVREIARWVMGWGGAAEVVRPLELRRRVAAAFSAAVAMYRDVVPDGPAVRGKG
jgi:WYL domain